jgi:alkylglycerol monooxygenase
METYGKILLIAMPAFLVLVLFEKWYGVKKGNDTVHNLDMISSLTSGVTNVTKDILGLTITIFSYEWLLRHVQLYTIQNSIITYIVAFIALDFFGYWTHRIAHKVNFFWNYHLIHHSSEEFNLACALRQSISGFINLFSFFLLPAALLGVPTMVIATVAPLHLFAQFWYHTQHINKMGFLEKIIVTPSHHRVHHAINPEYIDKNLGQIFIFWDKLFGTYQEEIETVKPVYGITVAVQTWNPIKINFNHWAQLGKDAWHTNSWLDKFKLWFMPTGWRPKDMQTNYPITKPENIYTIKKYDTLATSNMKIIYWSQLIILLLFISYFFGNIASISFPNLLLYGSFIFVYVYALTDLMDVNNSALFFEGVKTTFGCCILLTQSDWFGISNLHSILPLIILLYLISSFIITFRIVALQKHLSKLTYSI